MVKTNCSTLHTAYNIQQSATQGSNDMTHRLSHRTAATTRFSPEGTGCQKQTAPRFCQHPIRWAFYLASTHQLAPPKHTSDQQACYSKTYTSNYDQIHSQFTACTARGDVSLQHNSDEIFYIRQNISLNWIIDLCVVVSCCSVYCMYVKSICFMFTANTGAFASRTADDLQTIIL